jgi:hypothetical protein
MDPLAQPKHQKMDMKSGTCNIMSLYRTASLKAVMRELENHKVDAAGVQEARWKKGGTEWAEDYIFFYE